MKNLPYFGVASQQVTTHACLVTKVEGSYRGTTARWIQIHDSQGVPAEGLVPIKSYPVVAATAANPIPFRADFIAGELAILNGLYVCVSTTDGTKTLSTDVMDLEVELTQPEEPAAGSVVGDLTTAIKSLQVWSEATGAATPKRLRRVDVIGAQADSTAKYLMGFAIDNPPDGTVPLFTIKSVIAGDLSNGTAVASTFGKNGRNMFAYDTASRQGCTLVASTTLVTLTKVLSNDVCIRAEYI